jgi:acetyltransferase-like isoleucine patch superfamily enzyme
VGQFSDLGNSRIEFRRVRNPGESSILHYFSFRGNVAQSAEEELIANVRELPADPFFRGLKNRILHLGARFGPGSAAMRVKLHRWRGVKIGQRVHIGTDVLLETAYPQWVSIGNGVQIGLRSTIIAHLHGLAPRKTEHDGYVSVRIEDDANIGAGVIVLPNVTIGHGAVVTAGSVVSRSVAPLYMVQGNPARPIAKCGIPLTWNTTMKEFFSKLEPVER